MNRNRTAETESIALQLHQFIAYERVFTMMAPSLRVAKVAAWLHLSLTTNDIKFLKPEPVEFKITNQEEFQKLFGASFFNVFQASAPQIMDTLKTIRNYG